MTSPVENNKHRYIHEWSGTPYTTLDRSPDNQYEHNNWWYTTCNCSSHWPLKLTELHTFTDCMQHFIKNCLSSEFMAQFVVGQHREKITSSHIRCRMVECVFPSVMSPYIRLKGIGSITYYRNNTGVGLWIQNSGASF